MSTIGKAIYESNTQMATVKAETRKRNKWGYIAVTELTRWATTQPWPTASDGQTVIPVIDETMARLYFGVRLDAPVQRGHQGENELFAVWRKLDEPDSEPDFFETPPPASSIEVLDEIKALEDKTTEE